MAAQGTVRITAQLCAGVAPFRASKGVCHPPPAVTLCRDRQTDRWRNWGGPSRKTATFCVRSRSEKTPFNAPRPVASQLWDKESFSLCSAVPNDPLLAMRNTVHVEWHQLLSGAVELMAYCILTKLQIGFGDVDESTSAGLPVKNSQPSQLSSIYRPLCNVAPGYELVVWNEVFANKLDGFIEISKL